MSSAFKVTPSILSREAEELTNLNERFKRVVEQLETSENALNGMWDGEANDTFHTAFITDKEKMIQFYNLIIKYANQLKTISDRYAKAEQKNTGIASKRTY